MVISLTATNYLGESLLLDLRKPEETGILIEKIQGIGPAKGSINSTELSTVDGAIFNSSRITSRNIVIKAQLLRSPSVEASRLRLYQYFPVKRKVTLTFETSSRVCQIDGYVESNELDIFAQEETAQISIICPDPYFYSTGADEGTQTITFAGIENSFEAVLWTAADGYFFPDPEDDEIEFGQINANKDSVIHYSGDGEIGMTIVLRAVGDVSNPVIYRADTNESISLTMDLVSGDQITICTVKGKKSITLLRNGVTTNILRYRTRSSSWIQLTKGINLISFDADDGLENIQMSIKHDTIYEGI